MFPTSHLYHITLICSHFWVCSTREALLEHHCGTNTVGQTYQWCTHAPTCCALGAFKECCLYGVPTVKVPTVSDVVMVLQWSTIIQWFPAGRYCIVDPALQVINLHPITVRLQPHRLKSCCMLEANQVWARPLPFLNTYGPTGLLQYQLCMCSSPTTDGNWVWAGTCWDCEEQHHPYRFDHDWNPRHWRGCCLTLLLLLLLLFILTEALFCWQRPGSAYGALTSG